MQRDTQFPLLSEKKGNFKEIQILYTAPGYHFSTRTIQESRSQQTSSRQGKARKGKEKSP
ncbi:hypothetical protein F5144DRAFT_564787 [Chaetomium tenue]|uniref:Uncharacterized protein n=1 Tax=Chaetomium tenue TaxID=1854479 RepID=A0ACB7PJI3_9PEZI|nr:hypothetical protein F5144DRAFT_564787 [Chaetomium globosum]